MNVQQLSYIQDIQVEDCRLTDIIGHCMQTVMVYVSWRFLALLAPTSAAEKLRGGVPRCV